MKQEGCFVSVLINQNSEKVINSYAHFSDLMLSTEFIVPHYLSAIQSPLLFAKRKEKLKKNDSTRALICETENERTFASNFTALFNSCGGLRTTLA